MRHVAAKVAANDAVPGWALAFVELEEQDLGQQIHVSIGQGWVVGERAPTVFLICLAMSCEKARRQLV